MIVTPARAALGSIGRRRAVIAARGVVLATLVAGCAAPPSDHLAVADLLALDRLIGAWDWHHREVVDGVERDERERWTLDRGADWTQLVGRYQRTVVFTATDGVPFTCAQAPRYRLASTVELAIHATPGGAVITLESGPEMLCRVATATLVHTGGDTADGMVSA